MNLKRKAVELFGGAEVKKILVALDGHKSSLGLVIAALPDIANQLVALLMLVSPLFAALEMDGAAAYITRASGLLIAGAGGLHRALKVLREVLKDSPAPKVAPVLLLLLLPAFASAQEPPPQDFLAYVKGHASIVSGVEVAGDKAEFVSLALDDDFALGGEVRGFASLSLFSRQRAANPELPTSLEALALYSAGEVHGGAYFAFNPRFAFECRAGMAFAMVGLTGMVGDPVDGSKFLGGCGPRISGPAGRLSVLIGHAGPVDEGAKWFGFIPSTIVSGEFVLPSNMAFVVDIAAGRNLQTDKAITSSRFAVRKRF